MLARIPTSEAEVEFPVGEIEPTVSSAHRTLPSNKGGDIDNFGLTSDAGEAPLQYTYNLLGYFLFSFVVF